MLSFTKKLAIAASLFALISPQFIAVASNSVEHDAPKNIVVQVCDGVWAGQGVADSGEPIYFGLERIDEQNYEGWNNYRFNVDRMTTSTFGRPSTMIDLVNIISTGLENEINAIATDCTIQNNTGYSEADLNILVKKLQENLTKLPLMTALQQLELATNQFKLGGSGVFVAYVSKIPVTGRYPFSPKPGTQKLNLKEFHDHFGNILVCVAVYDRPIMSCYGDVKLLAYENRGVFKNPAAMLDKNYKGLSVLLTAFTGAAMSPQMKYLTLRPMKAMHTFLCKRLKPGEMYVEYVGWRHNLSGPEHSYFSGFVAAPKDLAILDSPEAEGIYLQQEMSVAKSKCAIDTYSEASHLIKTSALLRLYENMGKNKVQ